MKYDNQGRREQHSHHGYLVPALEKVLSTLPGDKLLDLGCGSGAVSASMQKGGRSVTGTEFRGARLDLARSQYPEVEFLEHDLVDPMPPPLVDEFDIVTAVEVIEHLLLPRVLFERAREALKPGGHFVLTTPYHGWLKNVAIAVTGNSDLHYETKVDYGHVKFFSVPTLTHMAEECGFDHMKWEFVGRIKPLAKSMILVCQPQ